MGELLNFTPFWLRCVCSLAKSRLQDKIAIRTCNDDKVMFIARFLNSVVVFRFPQQPFVNNAAISTNVFTLCLRVVAHVTLAIRSTHILSSRGVCSRLIKSFILLEMLMDRCMLYNQYSYYIYHKL